MSRTSLDVLLIRCPQEPLMRPEVLRSCPWLAPPDARVALFSRAPSACGFYFSNSRRRQPLYRRAEASSSCFAFPFDLTVPVATLTFTLFSTARRPCNFFGFFFWRLHEQPSPTFFCFSEWFSSRSPCPFRLGFRRCRCSPSFFPLHALSSE